MTKSKPSQPVMEKQLGPKNPGLIFLCRDALSDTKTCLAKFPLLMVVKEALILT